MHLPIVKHIRKALAVFFLAMLPLVLTQCVLSNSDPGFDQLARTMEVNPSPTAIVGMWHRHDTRAVPGGSTTSILFQSNGTMVIQGRAKMLGADVGHGVETHRYYYAGGGIWKMSDQNVKFALSQGHLLFHLPIPQYYDVLRLIFDRQG